jgi:hypothetical protein
MATWKQGSFMSSSGNNLSPADPTSPPPLTEPPGASEKTGDRLNRPARWVALAGLMAGLVAFGVGEAVYQLIPAETVTVNTMGRMITGPDQATMAVAEVRNGALTFGLFGLCLAGFLGMAGGLARRSASRTLVAGLLGSILGLASGAALSLAILPLALESLPAHLDYNLMISAIMHGSIWGLSGGAAGLAFATGLGKRGLVVRATAAGIVGAVLGAVAFDMIAAVIFPLANTGQPISTTWPSRLMARLLVAIATTGFVMLSAKGLRGDEAARHIRSSPASDG